MIAELYYDPLHLLYFPAITAICTSRVQNKGNYNHCVITVCSFFVIYFCKNENASDLQFTNRDPIIT